MTFFSLIRQVCVCNNTTQSPPQERHFIRFSSAKTGKTRPLPISTVYRPTRRSPAGAIPTRRGKTGLRRLVAGLTASGSFPWPAARLRWMPAGWKTICRTAAVRRCHQTGRWKATTPQSTPTFAIQSILRRRACLRRTRPAATR